MRALTWSTRPTVSTEALVLLSSLFFALVCNQLFWRTAMATHPGSIGFAISLMALLVAVHALLLGILVWRWNAKPLLTLLLFTTALAAHYMDSYNVYLDADMLRNVLHTDHKESRELLTPGLILPLVCYFLIPTALLWRTRLRARSAGKAVLVRSGFLLVVAVVGAAGAMLSSQDISALMRNHREARYLATPINYIVALRQNLKSESPIKRAPKQPIEHDAMATPRAPGS
ncbi:phosphoethanolamine transferase, partial [Xanthomonas perforans]